MWTTAPSSGFVTGASSRCERLGPASALSWLVFAMGSQPHGPAGYGPPGSPTELKVLLSRRGMASGKGSAHSTPCSFSRALYTSYSRELCTPREGVQETVVTRLRRHNQQIPVHRRLALLAASRDGVCLSPRGGKQLRSFKPNIPTRPSSCWIRRARWSYRGPSLAVCNRWTTPSFLRLEGCRSG